MTAPLLFPAPGPRLFAVPPGVDFAQALAAGLRARLADAPPQAIARITLTLNANRAARAAALAFEGDGPSAYLPRIGTLDDIVADPRLDLPPAVDPGRRALTLIRLVTRFLEARPDLGPPAAAPALAGALGALMDETAREGVDLDRLDDAAPPEHARHWETTLAFLQIVRQAWPQVLAADEGGAVDPEAQRRLATDALTAAWAADPPAHPVIAAGSTGSRAVTADYLRAVARLPQGAVVLPGFDPAIAAEVWGDIGPEHPWAGMRDLADRLGVTPDRIAWWTDDAPAGQPRRRLIAQAMRPAPVTDRWREALPALRAEIGPAADGLTIVEAPDPRRESAAIALALRQAIETPGARAALITPDRALARRVAAQLARWGIEPDDSGGRPLALTPPGVFLRLTADAAFARFDAVALLSLLKHPLMMAGPGREAHLRAARAYEITVLRRRPDLDSLTAAAQAVKDEDSPLHAVFAQLMALQSAPGELQAMADAHLATAQALAGPALWDKAAGEAARDAAARFAAAAVVFGPCPAPRYPPIFAAAMTDEAREDAFRPDPRVMIWGPLEARMQSADLIVLGGLNEGAWPAAPSPDPWLSRPMRARVGLPSPERRIGLGAHDVLTAACAPRVILTRAERSGGAPTTRSRWLERLITLCRGVDETALDAMLARGAALVGLADLLDRPASPVPRAPRPAPRPPAAHRPDMLSATQVETLIRDPFAIYARLVLRLKALDPVGRDLGARDRGVALHAALEALAMRAAAGQPLEQAFEDALDLALTKAPAAEAQRRLWRARMRRAAPALLKQEAARQSLGSPRVEVEGRRDGAGFTLKARADRIDLRDGAVAIYDYKTGPAPTDKQMQAFAKQLPLEAAIAEAGGFADIPPARVVEMAHIVLGGDGAGKARPVKGDPADLAAEAWAGLTRLIAAYADPATGYPARARPRHIAHYSDYDHLSRYGEWEDGDAAEDAPA